MLSGMALEDLTDLDLESSAMACRSLAAIRRKDAEANPGGSYTTIFLAEVERLERLAARYQGELDQRRGHR